MAMSLLVNACLNLSQARPSLLRRVIGPLSGGPIGEGLDRSTSGQVGEASTLGLATGAAWSRTTTGVVDSIEESTFCFLLPQRLGRLPVSNLLDTVFLFSEKVGGKNFAVDKIGRRVWAISSSPDYVTSSPTTPFPLFSFMVAIPTKKKDALGSTRINQSKQNEINNLHLRVVSSWASASSVGSGLSPQVVRRWRVTKKWKVLSAKECARWMRSR